MNDKSFDRKDLLITRDPKSGLVTIHDPDGRRVFEGDKGTCLFLGDYVESPNKQFALAWGDGPLRENQKDVRLLLLDGESIIFDIIFHDFSVDEGAVSNTGICIFFNNTWKTGEKSNLTVLDGMAREFLLRQIYQARLCECAISDDGLFAICRTLKNEHPSEELIHFFDTKQKKELWAKEPTPANHADSYKIDTTAREIHYIYEDSPTLFYDFEGNCLNPDDYLKYRVSQGDYNAIYRRISDLEQIQDLQARKKGAENLYRITAQAWQDDERGRSFLSRALGELFELLEMPERALNYYQIALQIDPKVGVKGRADKLRKQLVKAKDAK